jgi:hypothetical protein
MIYRIKKPSYQSLKEKFENLVQDFLASQKWNSMLKKTDVRESLRKRIDGFVQIDFLLEENKPFFLICRSNTLKSGMDKVIDQIVSSKIETTFRPTIEKLFYQTTQTYGLYQLMFS